MTRLEDLRAAARAANEELEKEERIQSEPIHKLASALHGFRCNLPHEDRCGWWIEESLPNTWELPSHKTWVAAAQLVLPVATNLFGDSERTSVDYTIELLKVALDRRF